MKETKVYVVKHPQGAYEDYQEPIVKVFFNEKEAKLYVKEENAKLPLEQAKKCDECYFKWTCVGQKGKKIPSCFNGDKYNCCENYFKYSDIQELFIEKHEIDDIKDHDREKDKRIKELEQDLEFTTKTANELIEIKHKLEQELAELKEKAIVPKFKTYQLIFYITQYYTSTKGNAEYDIISDKYYVAENENEIILGWNYAKDFNQRKYYYVRKDWVFATEQEAQEKLKEIQGNE